jgi:hypothetical protein
MVMASQILEFSLRSPFRSPIYLTKLPDFCMLGPFFRGLSNGMAFDQQSAEFCNIDCELAHQQIAMILETLKRLGNSPQRHCPNRQARDGSS